VISSKITDSGSGGKGVNAMKKMMEVPAFRTSILLMGIATCRFSENLSTWIVFVLGFLMVNYTWHYEPLNQQKGD
jgi:hypothetical protein